MKSPHAAMESWLAGRPAGVDDLLLADTRNLWCHRLDPGTQPEPALVVYSWDEDGRPFVVRADRGGDVLIRGANQYG